MQSYQSCIAMLTLAFLLELSVPGQLCEWYSQLQSCWKDSTVLQSTCSRETSMKQFQRWDEIPEICKRWCARDCLHLNSGGTSDNPICSIMAMELPFSPWRRICRTDLDWTAVNWTPLNWGGEAQFKVADLTTSRYPGKWPIQLWVSHWCRYGLCRHVASQQKYG